MLPGECLTGGFTVQGDVHRRRLTVLMVDDHMVFAEMLCFALSTQPDITCVGIATSVAEGVAAAVTAYRTENGLSDSTLVPVDAVTASGSGLDPHISIANARLQVARVAKERKLSADQVNTLVDKYTDGRQFVVLGEPGVNVVELNLALDGLAP